MPSPTVPAGAAEYTLLRQTISTRGTARMVLVPIVCFGWAALSCLLLLGSGPPLATVLPLAVLAAGFEAVHALHAGAERIGRYLQVYYESAPNGPRWETVAKAVGPALPGGGVDPLFSGVFLGLAAINLASALTAGPGMTELLVLALIHLAYLIRVVRARTAGERQRAVDLESFKGIQASASAASP